MIDARVKLSEALRAIAESLAAGRWAEIDAAAAPARTSADLEDQLELDAVGVTGAIVRVWKACDAASSALTAAMVEREEELAGLGAGGVAGSATTTPTSNAAPRRYPTSGSPRRARRQMLEEAVFSAWMQSGDNAANLMFSEEPLPTTASWPLSPGGGAAKRSEAGEVLEEAAAETIEENVAAAAAAAASAPSPDGRDLLAGADVARWAGSVGVASPASAADESPRLEGGEKNGEMARCRSTTRARFTAAHTGGRGAGDGRGGRGERFHGGGGGGGRGASVAVAAAVSSSSDVARGASISDAIRAGVGGPRAHRRVHDHHAAAERGDGRVAGVDGGIAREPARGAGTRTRDGGGGARDCEDGVHPAVSPGMAGSLPPNRARASRSIRRGVAQVHSRHHILAQIAREAPLPAERREREVDADVLRLRRAHHVAKSETANGRGGGARARARYPGNHRAFLSAQRARSRRRGEPGVARRLVSEVARRAPAPTPVRIFSSSGKKSRSRDRDRDRDRDRADAVEFARPTLGSSPRAASGRGASDFADPSELGGLGGADGSLLRQIYGSSDI